MQKNAVIVLVGRAQVLLRVGVLCGVLECVEDLVVAEVTRKALAISALVFHPRRTCS